MQSRSPESRTKSTLLVLAVVSAFIVSPETASAQFGIAAGANFEKLGDLDATMADASFDRSTGYHVGLFFNLGAGSFAVQPGVFLRDFGDVTLVDDARSRSFSMTAIEVPVDLRWHPLSGVPASPFLMAGPVVGFATTTDESVEDALTQLTLSANVGVGVEIGLSNGGFALVPELRLARSLTRFFEEGETIDIGGVDFTPVDASRHSAVMLRLGVRF